MTTKTPEYQAPPISLSHLSAFTDNIYAFSMTILITTLRLPSLSEKEASTGLFIALGNEWRFLAIYAISFLSISGYWLLQHTLYTHILKTDRLFIWLNILLLLAVTFLPFPTALMGKYGRHQGTAFIYGLVMVTTYFLINLITWYACRNRRLVSPEIPDAAIRLFRIRLMAPLLLAVAGTLLSLSYIRLAFLFFALVAVANSFPWFRFFKFNGFQKPGNS